MIHLVLFLICVLSVEILFRFKLLKHFLSITDLIKKVIRIIPNKLISDHWKELVIPHYALLIMKYSLMILLTLVLIICIFLITDYFMNGFLTFTLSIIGIIESILVAFCYTYLRKLIIE